MLPAEQQILILKIGRYAYDKMRKRGYELTNQGYEKFKEDNLYEKKQKHHNSQHNGASEIMWIEFTELPEAEDKEPELHYKENRYEPHAAENSAKQPLFTLLKKAHSFVVAHIILLSFLLFLFRAP